MTIRDEISDVLAAHDIATRNFGPLIRPHRDRPDYVLHVEIDDRDRAVAVIVDAGLMFSAVRSSPAGGFIHIWL